MSVGSSVKTLRTLDLEYCRYTYVLGGFTEDNALYGSQGVRLRQSNQLISEFTDYR
jgi:hypothetical protein